MSWIVYTGSSMTGVFRPGDTLLLESAAFEALRPGDIVAVESVESPYVHRIVRMDASGATTQGDHNRKPDKRLLTAEDRFFRVVGACSFGGVRRSIEGGAAGLRQFRRHQRYLRFRRWMAMAWDRVEPWAFWRLTAREESRFSNRTYYSWHGVSVAYMDETQRIRYVHPFKRIFFKVATHGSERQP